jgi:hypothetical protein
MLAFYPAGYNFCRVHQNRARRARNRSWPHGSGLELRGFVGAQGWRGRGMKFRKTACRPVVMVAIPFAFCRSFHSFPSISRGPDRRLPLATTVQSRYPKCSLGRRGINRLRFQAGLPGRALPRCGQAAFGARGQTSRNLGNRRLARLERRLKNSANYFILTPLCS